MCHLENLCDSNRALASFCRFDDAKAHLVIFILVGPIVTIHSVHYSTTTPSLFFFITLS
jgi:hypothetical protein